MEFHFHMWEMEVEFHFMFIFLWEKQRRQALLAFSFQLPSTRFHSNGTHSRLRFRPEDDDDFGMLRCRAWNQMGQMEMPCEFNVIAAGERGEKW